MISNNFGRRKNNPAKDRKALETYVSLRGYKHGEIGRNHFQKDQNGLSEKSTLTEIAKELNMSISNLKRALRIERNLTDSMKELLDTGEIYGINIFATIVRISQLFYRWMLIVYCVVYLSNKIPISSPPTHTQQNTQK